MSINNDTVYIVAVLDLSGGPLRLEVPDAADRYYVLQFVDAWTNNFAYVGRRATGTAAASFWIVPPGFEGDLPDEAAVIHAPTMVAVIVGRWAVAGADDLPAVHRLQDALRLTAAARRRAAARPRGARPGRRGGPALPRAAARVVAGVPAGGSRAGARRALRAPRPGAGRRRRTRGRRRAGTPRCARACAAGRERLEQIIKEGDSPKQNGWELTYHVFDYNDDFFELGALDDPQWRIADRRRARVTARRRPAAGLWGNHAYEAAYVVIWVDGEGEPLTGERSYTIRFEQTPPVDAFWSITMYDVPEFFLVANPIDRYSIGDRTPGLRRDDDGALTLVLQRDDPGDDERGNWLPTPPAPSGRSCACTRRGRRCSTAASSFRPSSGAAEPQASSRSRRAAASTPSTRTSFSRAFAPRTRPTRDGATPARAAISRHSASLARPSTGGAVTRTA